MSKSLGFEAMQSQDDRAEACATLKRVTGALPVGWVMRMIAGEQGWGFDLDEIISRNTAEAWAALRTLEAHECSAEEAQAVANYQESRRAVRRVHSRLLDAGILEKPVALLTGDEDEEQS